MALLVLDESERGEFLAVGGLIVPTGLAYDLEAEWRQLKATYGLPAGLPLKWAPDGESAEQLRAQGLNVDDMRRSVCRWLGSHNEIKVLVIVHQERRKRVLRPGRGGVRDFYATGVAFSVQRFAQVVSSDPRFGGKPHLVLLDNITWSRGRRSPLWGEKIRQGLAQLKWGAQKHSIVPWMAGGHRALSQEYGEWLTHGFPDVGIAPLEDSGFLSSFLEAHGEKMDIVQMADFICGCAAELFSSVASGRTSPVARGCMKVLVPRFCKDIGFGSGIWGCGIVLYPPNRQLWHDVHQQLGP